MNMHGIMTPPGSERFDDINTRWFRVRGWLWQRRVFGAFVALPTLLLAGYLYLIATDQYESEAHFLVRSTAPTPTPSAGMSQALSMVTGVSAAQNESTSVADYLTSHDAVEALRSRGRLVERFHRDDADFFSRLRQSNPTPERLLKYYRRQVTIRYDTETGITTLKVHSFRPNDSYELVRMLLQLGEMRVNVLNQRSYTDSIAMATRQVSRAEDDLARVQTALTRFRQNRRDIDPQASGEAQIDLVTKLSGELSAARAQLSSMGQMIDRSSPQYRALSARVTALQAQLGAQSSRLTGGDQAIAADISGYQDLQLRQKFLASRYEAAAASLDRARDQAIRQQLYLVRVVDANMPVKPLFPERERILLTVVISLLLAYAIGWLIVAGVREHAA